MNKVEYGFFFDNALYSVHARQLSGRQLHDGKTQQQLHFQNLLLKTTYVMCLDLVWLCGI